MHQAIPFRTWTPLTPPITSIYNKPINNNPAMDAKKLVTENALIVFGIRGCCMCHVVKSLLFSLGVNPSVHEVDEADQNELMRQLKSLKVVDLYEKNGTEHQGYVDEDGDEMIMTLPVVYVGGKLFGGLDRVMATHIAGELVPLLKRAGALWL